MKINPKYLGNNKDFVYKTKISVKLRTRLSLKKTSVKRRIDSFQRLISRKFCKNDLILTKSMKLNKKYRKCVIKLDSIILTNYLKKDTTQKLKTNNSKIMKDLNYKQQS